MSEGRRQSKAYKAKSFAQSAMACPGCRMKMSDPVEVCVRCGFGMGVASAKFPFEAPPLRGVIDPNGVLGEDERDSLSERLSEPLRNFPQVRACVAVISLDEAAAAQEFGFWMFNASPVEDAEAEEARRWMVLFLVDLKGGSVSATTGYALEPFVSDEGFERIFQQVRRELFQGDFAKVFRDLVDGLDDILWKGALRVAKVGVSESGE